MTNADAPRFFVFGSSGLLGSLFCESLFRSNLSMVACISSPISSQPKFSFDFTEPDLLPQKLSTLSTRPDDWIINFSAIANPSYVFSNPELSHAVNVQSASKLLQFAIDNDLCLLQMSSVEVFDGLKSGYVETDRPNPLNLYGRQKLESELNIAHSSYPKVITARTSWNISPDDRGRCLVDVTLKSLLQPDPRMATDNIFTIACAAETSANLLHLALTRQFGTFHIACTESITRSALADMIINYSSLKGLNLSYTPCLFSDLSFAEPRSKKNILVNSKSMSVGCSYRPAREIIYDKLQYLFRVK